MGISEKKMQIVINNYFEQECDVNTSIREAFEKGFKIGAKKGQSAQPYMDADIQKIQELEQAQFDTVYQIGVEEGLQSAQSEISEKLSMYKCYITDGNGLQHEVIHTGDIRRVTGWMI